MKVRNPLSEKVSKSSLTTSIENLSNRSQISSCRRLVIKIGTSSLTNSKGTLNELQVENLVRVIAELKKNHNKEVLLVTSGAIGAGVGVLGFRKRPVTLPHLQMAAAIGQSHLMSVYGGLFRKENLFCAQILLTHDDLKNRSRHVNAVNAFEAMLAHNVIPIINENDVVAVDEIKVGDNDTLAAMVAIMCKADLMVLMTTTNGLRTSTEPGAPRVPFIESISSRIVKMACGKTNQFSTGGMQTKLLACRQAALVGIPSLIIDSRDPRNLSKALAGEDLGTMIAAPGKLKKLLSKKRYLGFFSECKGTLRLDEGAVNKIRKGNSSLLAVGISSVEGSFPAGSVVALKTIKNEEIGRGITTFSSRQIRLICNNKDNGVTETKTRSNKTVVHHDYLTLLER